MRSKKKVEVIYYISLRYNLVREPLFSRSDHKHFISPQLYVSLDTL